MIINFCTNDPEIDAAVEAAGGEFGQAYEAIYTGQGIDLSHIPELNVVEDIVLIGHGTEAERIDGPDGGRRTVPVIGDGDGGNNVVDAATLWEALESRLPDGFQGRIFVDACSSSDRQEVGPNVVVDFSFADAVHSLAQERYDGVRVFGHEGDSDVAVIPLDDPLYIETNGGDVPVPPADWQDPGGGGTGAAGEPVGLPDHDSMRD